MGSPPFARSAGAYDLLYRSKDYAGEARSLCAALRLRGADSPAVLDLGCGTGRHAVEFARRGCLVVGADRSPRMLARARARSKDLPPDLRLRLSWVQADVRRLRLKRRFDAVVALFHVFSYLAKPKDLDKALATARAHLRAGGLILFDCWHGPAALASPAGRRLKRARRGHYCVARQARPRHDPARRLVEVVYRFTVTDGKSAATKRFEERHVMRYWFPEEIRRSAAAAGLRLIALPGWTAPRKAGDRSWNVRYAAVRARQPAAT